MKRAMPFDDQVDISSDDSSSSSSSSDAEDVDLVTKRTTSSATMDERNTDKNFEGSVIRKAQMYQEYMKHVPIPASRGSVIPYNSWTGLAKSIKKLYEQPLHYLTNIRVKQWDQQRLGAPDENEPLDILIHPCKAEASIWLIEEVHRISTSHHYLAQLWMADPMYHSFVDPVVTPLRKPHLDIP